MCTSVVELLYRYRETLILILLYNILNTLILCMSIVHELMNDLQIFDNGFLARFEDHHVLFSVVVKLFCQLGKPRCLNEHDLSK